MVGLVLVSHSEHIARGLADLAGQMAGPDVPSSRPADFPAAGSAPTTTVFAMRSRRANCGDGVVVIGIWAARS